MRYLNWRKYLIAPIKEFYAQCLKAGFDEADSRYQHLISISGGRRPEFVGGGLVRSSVVKAMRRGFERIKGDERILGEGDFVETVLEAAQEKIDRNSQLEAAGYSFDWLVGLVARQLEIEQKDVLAPGKYAQSVEARSLLCYWGARELGMTTVDLARRLNLVQPTVSQAAMRGQKIAEDQGLCLLEKSNQ